MMLGDRLKPDQDHEEKQPELEDEIAGGVVSANFGLAKRVQHDRQRIPAEEREPGQREQRRAGELDDRP